MPYFLHRAVLKKKFVSKEKPVTSCTNIEVCTFQFAELEGDDDEAVILEKKQNRGKSRGTANPPKPDELKKEWIQ
jgi:hypothetical protein